MRDSVIGADERERLEELYAYEILDTPPETYFDRLTELAAHVCDTPVALISLVDRDRQWFKSHFGIDATETPRDLAFCAHTILGTDVFVVEDAHEDVRFRDSELVRGPPYIRFYAAAPLLTARGFALGSLCVIDRIPRSLSTAQLTTLRLIAAQVVQHLDLHRTTETLRRQSTLFDKVQRTALIGGWEKDLETQVITWTDEMYRIHGLTRGDFIPTSESVAALYTPETAPRLRAGVEAGLSPLGRFDIELELRRSDGPRRWVRLVGLREDDNGQPRRLFGVLQDVTERRRLEREIVQIAQREQTRIGSDLHDGLGQELTGISLMLSGIRARLTQDPAQLREELERVQGLVHDAVANCRGLAQGLSPTASERGGLLGAIGRLAARLAEIHAVRIRIRTRGDLQALDPTIADHLFRIAQEALSNAIKHGGARHILVSLETKASRIRLSVTSDGASIPASTHDEGLGLGIMRYRARLIGATLDIAPVAAGGTRVRCRLASPPADGRVPRFDTPQRKVLS
jgi:PAS domain S-box-containing protein